MKTILKAALVASVSVAAAVTMADVASAQILTNGPDGMAPNMLKTKAKTYYTRRPLTVRRGGARVIVASPVAPAPAPVAPLGGIGTIVGAPIGAAGAVAGLPFQALGGIFPADLGARKGGVTSVRYAGTRDKVAEIDEGWAQAVPVDRSGPIYVVANGDPTISPLVLIGGPLRGIGAVTQLPFKIIGAGTGVLGATPAF